MGLLPYRRASVPLGRALDCASPGMRSASFKTLMPAPAEMSFLTKICDNSCVYLSDLCTCCGGWAAWSRYVFLSPRMIPWWR